MQRPPHFRRSRTERSALSRRLQRSLAGDDNIVNVDGDGETKIKRETHDKQGQQFVSLLVGEGKRVDNNKELLKAHADRQAKLEAAKLQADKLNATLQVLAGWYRARPRRLN